MVIVLALLAGAVLVARRLLSPERAIEGVTVHSPTDDTRIGADGAVRSVQRAEIDLPEDMLQELWTVATLERLARTYWAFISTVTLGLIRVYYSEDERWVCLLLRPLRLLTFAAPEYQTDAACGVVRWRIDRGLLVAPTGRGRDGYLEITVRRGAGSTASHGRLQVEVEVANFYPNIANRLGRFLYTHTQSRIHVIVTHGFLRRLAKRELDESVIGRYRAQ
jgi:hypothetical protein